jgi:transposase-like protein
MTSSSPCCHAATYSLGDGMLKCSKCRRRYSPRKVEKERRLIDAFASGMTASEATRHTGASYPTVRNRFHTFRLLLTTFLETQYEQRTEEVREFEEYLYLEASKRGDKANIFDAQNFITFDYGGRIYNLMMPSLARFKQGFLDDGLDELYHTEFSKYLKRHKIAKLEKKLNKITEFWLYFEGFITRFKGVNAEHFPYFLKEAEFRFNYPPKEQTAILEKLWFASQ